MPRLSTNNEMTNGLESAQNPSKRGSVGDLVDGLAIATRDGCRPAPPARIWGYVRP